MVVVWFLSLGSIERLVMGGAWEKKVPVLIWNKINMKIYEVFCDSQVMAVVPSVANHCIDYSNFCSTFSRQTSGFSLVRRFGSAVDISVSHTCKYYNRYVMDSGILGYCMTVYFVYHCQRYIFLISMNFFFTGL